MSTRVQTVAEDLGARYLVEGSVRKAGNRLDLVGRTEEGIAQMEQSLA